MRPMQLAAALAVLWGAGVTLSAEAQAQHRTHGAAAAAVRLPPGAAQGAVHDPSSPAYADFLPASGPRHFGGWPGGGNTGNVYACGPGFSAFFGSIGPWNPWGWSNWNCGPVLTPGWGWGWSGNVCFSRPWVFSANELFGPNLEQLWNPLGLGNATPAPQVNIIQVQPRNHGVDGVPIDALPGADVPDNPVPDHLLPAPEALPGDQPADDAVRRDAGRPKVREANAAAVARAWRWIELGDKYFAKQEYRQAYTRYKEAAKAAPGLVEAYLRQGQAMVASGQYTLAAPAFRRALNLDADLRQARFELAELYAGRRVAQNAHLEALAVAAEKDPANADLLLLVGSQLFFDGQVERARPFWRQAAALLAPADDRLAAIIQRITDEQANAAQPVADVRDDV